MMIDNNNNSNINGCKDKPSTRERKLLKLKRDGGKRKYIDKYLRDTEAETDRRDSCGCTRA